jgi:hypothetical protein
MKVTTPADPDTLSAECTVAKRPAYRDLHRKCTRTKDIPLPHSGGIVLVRRCHCTCHTRNGGAS